MEKKEDVDKVARHVAGIVSRMSGIQLGEKQLSMVKNRLHGRLIKLKIATFAEYLEHLETNSLEESQALLSLMTTHHTFFFREFGHFEFLQTRGLERIVRKVRERGDRKIRIWSAAASRGQEAYSIAMFMRYHLERMAPDVDFEIWGTDIDPESIEIAKNGVYKKTELLQSPQIYVNENWIHGRGKVEDYVKVVHHLHQRCHFETANLLSCEKFLHGKNFDLIFCRNVYIYFDSQQITTATRAMLPHLDREGFLFLGVSESLNGLNLPLHLTSASTYQHPREEAALPPPKPVEVLPSTIRVLCVDDSPAILALMKKIFSPGSGFQIVGTAKNGREALQVLERETDVHAITLDLHMPEMDGMTFLEEYAKTKNPNKASVLIVSAINRDDASISKRILAQGAADYVEKPSLEKLAQARNEIHSKIKTILRLKASSGATAPVSAATPPAPAPVAPVPPVSRPSSAPKGLAPTAAPTLPAAATAAKKKRVLIVDDSPTIRQLLERMISSQADFEVVGKAERPSEVEGLIQKCKPDLITMDIHMPEMDGAELVKKLVPKHPIPIVMISSISFNEGPLVLRALENGAVDYIQKPDLKNLAEMAPIILERLRVASQIKVNRKVQLVKKGNRVRGLHQTSLLLMGASTGGTEALKVVLESLPSEIPPTLIVQHIPAGFSAAFANRLNDLLPFEVKEASDGDEVRENRVLIAPGGKQMALKTQNSKVFVEVSDAAPVNRHKPSVDFLFHSAQRPEFANSVAVILTGMGADGAREMKGLAEMGVRTIAQDKESSVVYGMPREAFEMGGAQHVEPLSQIGSKIMGLFEEITQKRSKKAA